jgi:hypothetical protein
MARSEKQVSIAYTGATVEFTFRQADGTFGDKYIFDATKAHQANRTHAELFGWNQRLVDSVADQSGAAAKREGIVALGDWYMAGGEEWEQKRKGGATGPRIATGDIVTAIATVYYSGDIDKTNRLVSKRAEKDNVGRDETLMGIYKADPDIAAHVVKLMRQRSAAADAPKANAYLDEMEGEAQ